MLMLENSRSTAARSVSMGMIGNIYGSLEVLSVRHAKKYGALRWFATVRCKNCGATYERLANRVRKNTSDTCIACHVVKPEVRFVPYKKLDGKVFNQLKVLDQVGEYIGAQTLWRCKCLACGGETTITQARLGIYDTCGCKSVAALKKGKDVLRALQIDGTVVSALLPTRKLNKNSSTGIRGVCLCGDGRYRATINLRRHQYDLGKFSTLSEAAAARKQAEVALYSDFIERYNAGEFSPQKNDK